MPERAVTIALATALQESQLVNIQHGDLDSLGLFQQRPSQGWGTKKEILDPTYAAGVFYKHLSKVDDYQQLPLTVAAQRVQRSGYPEAYAKHEPEATLLSAALTGQAAATLTCQGLPDSTQTAVGPDAVRAALVRDFGRTVLKETGAEVTASGSASKGTSKAKAESTPAPSASASGGSSTVTLPVRTGSTKTGWQLAHWAVANSSELHIERVSYAGREWAAGSADDPWHSTSSTKAAGGVSIVTERQTGQ
jgi:hypothetical protein